MLWRRSVTKSRRPSSARRFRCCSRGAICSARPRPAPARRPRLRLPMLQRIAQAASRSPRQTARAGARADPRAGDAGRRGGAQVRQRRRPVGAAALRRRADASADPRARARRPHRRRHARPRARSHPPRNAEARRACRCSCSTKPTKCSTWASPRISTRFSKATPATRQTALFSATMPARILSIAERHLKNPARVTIAREKTAAGKMPRVRQVAYIVGRAQKAGDARARILDMEDPVAALVFCRTRLEVESLVETLQRARPPGRRRCTAA